MYTNTYLALVVTEGDSVLYFKSKGFCVCERRVTFRLHLHTCKQALDSLPLLQMSVDRVTVSFVSLHIL